MNHPPPSGSWWTWTTTSSSITPTKTPSSSTSTATRTPTRSRWRRSEIPHELKVETGEKSESCDCWSAKIYEAAIDWPISLTDSIGDSLSVLGLSEVDAGASHPSLSLLHYEASWIFPYTGQGKTQTLKWGLCRNSHELATFMSLFFSTSLVWKLRAMIQDVLHELNCIKGFSTYILTLYSLLILPNNTSGLDLSDAWCSVCSHSLDYLFLK